MGRLIKFIFSRGFTTGVLIALQVLLTVTFLYWLSDIKILYYIFLGTSIFFAIYLFSSDQIVEYKLIWSLVIFMFPLLGGIFYVMWGKRSTDWRALRNLHEIYTETEPLLESSPNEFLLSEKDPSLKRVAKYLNDISDAGVYKDCSAKYYPSGESFFEPFIAELKTARQFICLEYFIIEQGKMWNTVLSILIEKVKQGVEVYLMYDDAGSVAKVPQNYYKSLRKLGIKAVKFNKLRPRMYTLMNYRDHRKIAVIDGKTAFTGGLNLADEYINENSKFGYWKDAAVKVQGEIVWEFTLMFFRLWCFASGKKVDLEKYRSNQKATGEGYIQFFGDDPLDFINVSEDNYINLIARAKSYVYITTPYLIINSRVIGALQTASRSGVDVRIITPGIPDKKLVFYVTQSYYKQLIEAGVKIYEFIPGFVHAKNLVSDDDVATVGTINMDYRSLYLHFECAAVFYNNGVVKDVKRDIEETFKKCRIITLADVKKTFFLKRITQAILRIFAPLM